LAGSPYPGAHYRKQSVDMNTESEQRVTRGPPVNTVGSFGELSKKPTPPGGININPILCINTWEHVYLPDYGVGAGGSGGKRAYAERWWNRIDWNTVAGNAEIMHKQSFMV
jgi:Fe-Mn family superoxide dismutase